MIASEELRRKLELVVKTGLLLAGHSDLQSIVQAATDAGMELCGAQFGAFFYNTVNEQGEGYLLYTLSGVEQEKFAHLPMPRNTAVFAPTFRGEGVVRSDDITRDPRYGQNAPHFGKPEGHLPVRSYLAIPVMAQSGDVLGGLFYGHEDVAVFRREAEDLVASVAAQAAIAIENARLRERQRQKVADAERERHEHRAAAMRLSEFAAIIESSNDAILSKDLNGVVMSWNPAAERILGYTAEEIVGTSILRLIPSEHLHEEESILAKIRSGQKIEHYETFRLTKSNQKLDVSLSISPVHDEVGRVIGASTILRDVSSKRRTEAALLQAEKFAAAGRMAATIAHEINNPLEAVTNLIFLAKSNADHPEEVRSYLATAEGEVARVSHIAKQTLGFYREHSSPVETTLADLVREAVGVYQRKFEEAGITVRLALEANQMLTVRKGEMMQVISNLIANAVYAMPSGGTLSIATGDFASENASGVLLTIEDTGVGIAHEHRDRIFEAFFTTRSEIGTGIGLFVARQFVERHEGTITVDSSTETGSHGTAFRIFLPAVNPSYARAAEPS